MKTYENVLCVIPARAGSQGIIDKNLQLIWGIPLVEHSILHALDAGLDPENIRVSSDSDEILDIALRNKVVANERPPQFSGPTSPTEETLILECDDHIRYRKHNNLTSCEHVLLLQPTSPIRRKGMINRFLDFYLDSDYDSALTTTKFYDFFWQKTGWGTWLGYSTSSYDPDNRPMRQALTEADYKHFDNGNAYLTNIEVLKEKKCRIGRKVGLFPISELEGMQIDTHEDLEMFRAIFSGKIPEWVGIK